MRREEQVCLWDDCNQNNILSGRKMQIVIWASQKHQEATAGSFLQCLYHLRRPLQVSWSGVETVNHVWATRVLRRVSKHKQHRRLYIETGHIYSAEECTFFISYTAERVAQSGTPELTVNFIFLPFWNMYRVEMRWHPPLSFYGWQQRLFHGMIPVILLVSSVGTDWSMTIIRVTHQILLKLIRFSKDTIEKAWG